jgi:hypothetical protein
MYIYYLLCLYSCKDYCLRLTTQLQLVIIIIIIIIIILNLSLPAFKSLMTKSEVITYHSVLDTVCSLHNGCVWCNKGVQPCFGERELLGRANLHFGPAGGYCKDADLSQRLDRFEPRFIKAALIME